METKIKCILWGKDGQLIILSFKRKNTAVQASCAQSEGKEKEIWISNPTHVHSGCKNLYTKSELIKEVAVEAKERVSICYISR